MCIGANAMLLHFFACAICPEGEDMTLKLRAQLGLYIQKIIYIGWVQLSFLVFPKDIDIAFQNI